MVLETSLTRQLHSRYPIIQAPLAGGGDTPALVAAVCEAGAFGFIGASYLTPTQITEAARAVRLRTSRPFGVNLFAPIPVPDPPHDVRPSLERVAPFYSELGLPAPEAPQPAAFSSEEQLAAALASGASVFSFALGILPAETIRDIKRRGLLVIGTATTVDEAVALERVGVDAVVAQGSEAGGHRSTFAAPFEAGMIGTVALVPQVATAITIPVIASGGIMDGRGIAAALTLGATAVQMGTAFLMCDESGVPSCYKDAILSATEHDTRVTRAFSGRPARGIVNRFMREIERGPDVILPFPLQNSLTRPLRAAAAKQDRPEVLSLWAGQGLRLARRQSAGKLVAQLVAEANAAVDRWARTPGNERHT